MLWGAYEQTACLTFNERTQATWAMDKGIESQLIWLNSTPYFSTVGASTTTTAASCSHHGNNPPCCGAESSFPRPSSPHHRQHGRASTDGALISEWACNMGRSFNRLLIYTSIWSLFPGIYSTFDE